MKKQDTFKDFGEFWYYTKELSQHQIDIIFHSLPEIEQVDLRKSYSSGGWEDLFKRNQINKILEDIKKDIGIDVIYIRCRVLSGKSYYMKRGDWIYINNLLSSFSIKNTFFAIGNIEEKVVNENTVLLTVENAKKKYN